MADIDARALDEVVTFTSDLIRIDTTNRGGGDCRERPAAEYAAERLAGAGLEPTLLERSRGRTNVVARIEGTDPSRTRSSSTVTWTSYRHRPRTGPCTPSPARSATASSGGAVPST